MNAPKVILRSWRHPRRRRALVITSIVAVATMLVAPDLFWRALVWIVMAESGASEWQPEPVDGVATECFDETEPVPWSYCVHRQPGARPDVVLYHLHARKGAATWWNDTDYYTGDVMRAWASSDAPAPTVVGVSFGPLWLLQAEPGSEGQISLLGVLTDEVIPRIERRLGAAVHRRMVVGGSMGGHNALMIFAHAPEHFDKVAALCPPVSTLPPDAGFIEVGRKVAQTSLSAKRALMLLAFGRTFYPTVDAWARNDPLQALRRGPPAHLPQLYVSCGAVDEWGCLEASELIVQIVRQAGGTVQWSPRAGGHCDVDAKELAEFLAR